MFCLELIKFDVSNTSYYVEVENVGLLHDVVRSWKMILGSRGKSWKFLGEIFLGKSVGTLHITHYRSFWGKVFTGNQLHWY